MVLFAARSPPGDAIMGDLFGAAVEPAFYRNAVISDCGHYRYRLERRWSDAPPLPFVMLNPSTADAMEDDPTIRRCMGFARREGAGGIVVANLYAYRATKPEEMMRAAAPLGADNVEVLGNVAIEAVAAGQSIVCAWGANCKGESAIRIFKHAGARLVCLGKTKDGSPRHPLYVRADQPLEPFP